MNAENSKREKGPMNIRVVRFLALTIPPAFLLFVFFVPLVVTPFRSPG